MNDEPTPRTDVTVIDLTAGFDLDDVEHPYAAAELVLDAA